MQSVGCVHDLNDVWKSFHISPGSATVAELLSHVSFSLGHGFKAEVNRFLVKRKIVFKLW